MKKIITLILAVAMILSLVGCGAEPEDSGEKKHTKKTEAAEEEEKEPETIKEESKEENASAFPTAVAKAEEETEKEYVPVLGDETLTKLEEALNVFPRYGDPIASAEEVGWFVDNMLVAGCGFYDPEPYLGISMFTGDGETPVDITYIERSKGEECPYYGFKTKDIENLINSYYGTSYSVPVGELNYETCINDGEEIREWSASFQVSYEGFYWETQITDAEVKDGLLYVTVKYTDSDIDGNDTVTTGEVVYAPNPDSYFGYSLKEYNVEIEDDLADPEYEDEFLNMSYDEIKAEESRIRNAVNSGAAVKVELKAGTDNFDFARWYCFENQQLVFVYYFNSISGDHDHRFYLKDGRMIEWIEGDGNDDSNRSRHYVYDAQLEPRWFPVENELLTLSEPYVK